MAINYTGLKELSTAKVSELKSIAEEYEEKFCALLQEHTCRVIFKEHSPHKDKAKFSITVHCEYPGKCVEGKGVDYHLSIAVHEAFDAVELQLKRKK